MNNTVNYINIYTHYIKNVYYKYHQNFLKMHSNDKSTQHNKCGNKKIIFVFNTHRFYTTLNHTYLLLQCKEHI